MMGEKLGMIGLGKMGLALAREMMADGHAVSGYDIDPVRMDMLAAAGGTPCANAREVAEASDITFSILLKPEHIEENLFGPDGIDKGGKSGLMHVEMSTMPPSYCQELCAKLAGLGIDMLDAPISGSHPQVDDRSITFMVGGSEAAFARAEPILSIMGKAVVHVGGPGNGQAAKICNNMILGISMIAVSEAFALGQKLGLKPDRLFEISSQSSGQCWSMTTYCPVPGPVPASPANRDYQAGFTAAMMLKDLVLAQDAAKIANAATPLGSEARALYDKFVAADNGGLDFSGIIKMIEAGG